MSEEITQRKRVEFLMEELEKAGRVEDLNALRLMMSNMDGMVRELVEFQLGKRQWSNIVQLYY